MRIVTGYQEYEDDDTFIEDFQGGVLGKIIISSSMDTGVTSSRIFKVDNGSALFIQVYNIGEHVLSLHRVQRVGVTRPQIQFSSRMTIGGEDIWVLKKGKTQMFIPIDGEYFFNIGEDGYRGDMQVQSEKWSLDSLALLPKEFVMQV